MSFVHCIKLCFIFVDNKLWSVIEVYFLCGCGCREIKVVCIETIHCLGEGRVQQFVNVEIVKFGLVVLVGCLIL